MDAKVADIHNNGTADMGWLLEHPALYTAGVSAKPGDLIDPDRFPVFASGRGGQISDLRPASKASQPVFAPRDRDR